MNGIKKHVLFIFLVVLVLYFVGYFTSGSSSYDNKNLIAKVVFNDCYVYEKLGEDFVGNSEHKIGSEIYDVNGTYSEIRIEGYNHIHYMLPRIKGGYYCAAIGNDGLKYILSLNGKKMVDSFVKVKNLPAKLFEYKDTLVAYYICDGEANLYSVDLQSGKQDLLVDGISISDSASMEVIENYYKNEQEYFNAYEFEYEKYLKSGKDLRFTLFDSRCFESVHLNDTSIVFKTDKFENKQEWIVKQDEEVVCFSNDDRCFGFVGESELLFYKYIHLGLYDVGLFYKYDYLKEKEFDFKVVLNRGILQGEIFDDKEKLYYSSSAGDRVYYYCLDIKTYERFGILKGCPTIGFFSRPIK